MDEIHCNYMFLLIIILVPLATRDAFVERMKIPIVAANQ